MISIRETEKINPLLFVASLLDPRYKMDILKFLFVDNVWVEKTEKIVSKLKNFLDWLYTHNVKNVGGSGARLSNEEWNWTISASVGVGTSNQNKKVL
jgi:hypothetical protein